ncbi:MAG: MFS transporter [Gammaproteobacteria bacterium]|nr:MFS transporter [Gammaproteobacteria bacterium]MDH3449020.1 MFS transporter [Gammaproteobacteria bacterium]
MSSTLEDLYDRITGDEDARVCKDIPEAACNDQPCNFFAYLLSNLLSKVADEIASAKLVIPWLFGALGVPAFFTGFLVPVREAGVLLPQLLVAAAVRSMPVRKTVWLLGAVLSALSLFGMAWAAASTQGNTAGLVIVLMLVVFSLARGICSVSAKDVLGKTISKSRRGKLMGWSASLSGIFVLGIGLWLGAVDLEGAGTGIFAGLLMAAGILWISSALAFAGIEEQPGATEGGGNALSVAVQQLGLLVSDRPFRRFVVIRTLLLSVALAPPFYVLIAQQQTEAGLSGLGLLIVANGLASSISSPFWGYLGDRSSRAVMALAAAGAGGLALITWVAVSLEWTWMTGSFGFAAIFLLLNVMHGGVRLGRKVYLVDMATAGTRAAYVAVSNTIIGGMMLLGGLVGFIGDWLGAASILLFLGVLSLVAAVFAMTLPQVSEP